MNAVIRIGLVITFVLLVVEAAPAKEWRGITPLLSTRADVVRLLNQCHDQTEACLFSSNDEEVYILFSGGLEQEFSECAKSLPPETVMFIQVKPRTKPALKKLRSNEKNLILFSQHGPKTNSYRTPAGLLVTTVRNSIVQFVYLAETANPQCTSYYTDPEPFLQTFWFHPPPVALLNCPENVRAGADLIMAGSATFITRRGPTWEVSAGKIRSGQYTHRLVVDTTGLVGQTINVTVEIADVFGHAASTSCRVAILPN